MVKKVNQPRLATSTVLGVFGLEVIQQPQRSGLDKSLTPSHRLAQDVSPKEARQVDEVVGHVMNGEGEA